MGSAITVENRVIKLQSVGVAVKHYTPTEEHHITRLLQGNRSPKKINKKLNFRIYRVN